MQALERLAARLYDEMDRLDAVSTRTWDQLMEGDKEWYRTCVEGLIQDWDLMQEAHAELVAHA